MLEEYMTGNNIEYKPALKVIYSEMATKFCKISTVDWKLTFVLNLPTEDLRIWGYHGLQTPEVP